MRLRIRHLPATWEPFPWMSLNLANRMHQVLERWRGSRYASGQSCAGVAADCVGFVFGAVDDLDGRERRRENILPADAAFHDPDTAQQALLELRRIYSPIERVTGPAQPFDVVAVGPAGGGASHVMLVGPERNTLWHATPGAGVHQAGWALGTGYDLIHGVYRIGDRERWIRL